MVLVATGNVDHAAVVKQAEELFKSVPETKVTTTELVAKDPAHFTGSEIRFRDPDMPKVYIAFAFRGAGWKDPDSVPLMVMQTILGAWDKNALAGDKMGSRLAQLIATQNPLIADSYLAFNTNYHDAGLFGVYTIADKDAALDDLGWAVMHETVRMVYNVTEFDCIRAKN
jgi:processing peptidase subunit beta